MDVMKRRKLPSVIKKNATSVLLILVFLLIVQFTHSALAKRGKLPRVKPGLVPAALIKWPDKGSNYAILVDKSQQKVFVYQRDNLLRPLKIYSASTGENDGPKHRKNDRKTPEGIYFFTRSMVQRELIKVIEGWRKAWEAEEIDRYMSFYSPKFTSSGKGWRQWRTYKAKLAKRYREITVEIHNLTLLRNDGVVLARFNQKYETDVFRSTGEKRLYLKQNSAEWKITGEFFRLAKKERVFHKKTIPPPSEDIRGFISSWKKAWEGKDLNTYISCYDPQFRSRGMDLRAWRKHREKLNRKYRSVKIGISDLSIVSLSNGTAKVRFKQRYQADQYSDFGLKDLVVIKKGPHWKIKAEQWRPLNGKRKP